jgi:hypothetical protein
MNALDAPIVLHTVGEATVAWQPTIGWMGLSIDAIWVLYRKVTTRTELVDTDQSVCVNLVSREQTRSVRRVPEVGYITSQ